MSCVTWCDLAHLISSSITKWHVIKLFRHSSVGDRIKFDSELAIIHAQFTSENVGLAGQIMLLLLTLSD